MGTPQIPAILRLQGGIFCWLLLFALALIGPVTADERILLFESTIKVQSDGSLRIAEKIRVRAEGSSIRRGIYRDFPVRYNDQNGYRRQVGFDITSVTRDGEPEPYFTKMSGDHERIYIGEKSVYLARGEYTYIITYETSRQLRYFADYDELYWNVTGNKWAFPIDKAIARIELPEGAKILNSTAFTGRYGERGKNNSIRSDALSSLVIETTNPLGRYEGLSVAVSWPKGIVPEPGPIAKWFWRVWDNIGFVFLLFGTLGVSAYYYIVWRWVGRDPEGGAIFPRFSPPADMSPAAVSYLHYMGFRRASSGATKPFIAALISLAVKGRLIIDDSGDDVSIKKAGKLKLSALPSGESAMLKQMLDGRDELVFKQSNHPYVQSARRKFKSALLKEYGGVFFKNNYGWFALGGAASIAVLVLAMWLVQQEEIIVFVSILTLFSVIGALMLSMGFRRLSNWLPGGDSRLIDTALIVLGTFLLVSTSVITLGISSAPAWVPFCGVFLGAVNVAFVHLMRAPTILGRQVMDEIEGFKMYLTVAEVERMNMVEAPDVSEEIFEKYLPYAIGLGVEKPWSGAFESYLAKTIAPGDGHSSYHPRWHSGSANWSPSSLAATTSGLVGAVSAGMAVASPPSSSGSSGGGGFSGGGGGGGGGGGW